MVIKRRDFQKAAAFIHEFLLKMNEDVECAELRDTLNLALLHMQKYYKLLQSRSLEKTTQTLPLSARGLSPMTPFVDAPDKFRWRWINLDNARLPSNMSISESINLTTLPPMIRAVKAGNLQVMQELIQQDAGAADDMDGIGRTGLMYAVHHTEHNALNFLLESQADVNAAAHEHNALNFLLESQADVNAAAHEHNALNFLLESQADVNAAAHDGSTALHYACHEENEVALSLLVDHGATMTTMDTQGRAPIHWAVTTPGVECLELLLENSAEPTQRDKDGLTPCMWACRMDHIKHFDLLCRADYAVSELDGIERDGNGRTWMHWAVRRTEPLECLQTLLTEESARYKDEDGKTVLMLAAEIGSLPATRLILEIAGISTLDDLDSQSRTALHLAVIGGHGDVVNFLLEQGADINQPDRYNATAWDYARNRQLHYCQLIIMSHQRQRMLSNPTSPLPTALPFLTHPQPALNQTYPGRWEQSTTPVTPPPHPPKRPRTSRVLQRRANSSSQVYTPPNTTGSGGRLITSAGPERKKERIEVAVNTRMATNNNAFLPASRQESTVTDEDINNVLKDVEINGEEDIDNVSEGGMDVSDIEDADQHHHEHQHQPAEQHQHQPANGFASYVNNPPPNTALRPQPAQRPALLRQQQFPQRQPQPPPPFPPPDGAAFQSVAPPHPPPPTAAPSYTRPLEPPVNPGDVSRPLDPPPTTSQPPPHPSVTQPPATNSKALYAPQAPPRPTLRAAQNPLRISPGRGPVPSPPNMDPQRPHMIRLQQPLPPPQPALRDPCPQASQQGEGESGGGLNEQAMSPQPSSQSSDQTSVRTQINVGGGGGGGVGSDPNRPNSGGTSSKNPGVSIEGRRIPPPMLTPLTNAPKLPLHGMFTPSAMEPIPERKKKKKKKGRAMAAQTQERDSEGKSPAQNPLEIPPPRGFAAPLHPGRERGHSAALHSPKYSRGQLTQSEARFVDENTQEDSNKPPPIINGFAMPIREGTMRSARPGQRTQPMELEEMPGPAGDAPHANHAEGVKESIAEEDEVGELRGGGGTLIPPPQGFRGGSSQLGARPLSQSMPQDKSSLRMAPTSAKPPLPLGGNPRNSASLTRRSSDKNPSPGRRPRPPTSKAN
ncbi:hypothetical protein ACOMHN_042349 [Nucella lapillus]